MKTETMTILQYGHDEHLLDTRRWVLESRGYKVLTVGHLKEFGSIPRGSGVRLLLLCHTLRSEERATAMALGRSRWPEAKSLALTADSTRGPAGLLGHLLHSKEGPARLISMVGELLGSERAEAPLTLARKARRLSRGLSAARLYSTPGLQARSGDESGR